MKIRYFLATVLFVGLFVYGGVKLLVTMMDRPSVPVVILKTVTPVVPSIDSSLQTTTIPAKVDTVVIPEPVAVVAPATVESSSSIPPSSSLRAEGEATSSTPLQWGEHTPGIVSKVKVSNSTTRTLFLTVNAYLDNLPAFTGSLTDNHIKATIFVSGSFARRNAETLKQWARNPLFDIQNMGDRCRSLSSQGQSVYNVEGTKNIQDALEEVNKGAKQIAAVTGKQPVYFRSATGYTDNVAVEAVKAAGTKVIGYNYVTDGGGTIPAEQVKNNILNATSGSILVISINPEYPNILKGLQEALDEIKTKQLPIKFEKLSDYENAFEFLR